MNYEEEKGKQKKTKKSKIEFDTSKCWFCLASPSVEKHLIIAVGTTSYLALAKGKIFVCTSLKCIIIISLGGIVEEHFLICPIEHYQNSIGHPQEVMEEISQFKETLHKFYDRNGQVPVFFERNYKTSHMQLQVIPIPKNADRELKDIFLVRDKTRKMYFDLRHLYF